ncbi:protein Ycf2-like [Helianthus annuus]|uniref:protein Ycf2-like n=1 Tax=Helianthus annuus TaxID=4232 RepID=UPI000B902817|nr:protein Ycf2-like [Helianthus annuus]
MEVQKKTNGDDYVEITGYKAATTPLSPPQDKPESSHPKDTNFDYIFEGLPTATGIYTEDIPEDDYDMFNNEAVNELMKKVAELEKEKAKVEAERNALKKRIEELMMANDQIRLVLIDQEEKLENNSKIFDVMQEEIAKLNKELEKQNDINQTLNQLISEISEASANEIRGIKIEMEAMKADKVMKDNQLSMLTAIIESQLKVDIHAAFNEVEVKRAEERRFERERLLAQEATERRMGVVEDVLDSSSQPEVEGSSAQQDIEMIEVEDVQDQDIEDVIDEQGQHFMLVGESSEPFDVNKVLGRVSVIQRKRKAKEMLLLEWKTQQFVLVGRASIVPYSIKEVARQIKIKEKRRKAKIARGEMVEDDSDIELFGDEEEDEDDNVDDKKDDNDDKDDKGDDDNDQGASRLLIKDPNVQERIEELMNDEINE